MTGSEVQGWERLRHGGLLLDAKRLREVAGFAPEPLPIFYERDLRKQVAAILDAGQSRTADITAFVAFVLQKVCGVSESAGKWLRGPQVPAEWGRVAVTGETVKPRQLWQGPRGGVLPVFIDREKRVGIGRGKRATSQVLHWLRAGDEQLALVTNGRQWRLVFAGLDFDAWCEPTTPAAVSSRFWTSRSSPVSWRRLRSAAATSASLAVSASARPSLLRRHDSAKAVGQLKRRLPRISTAKLPERRRRRSPLAMSFLTLLRKASNEVPSATSADDI